MAVPSRLWELLAAQDPPAGLGQAVERLAQRYRDGVGDAAPALRDQLERHAYVAARMPATSAAVAAALATGLERMPGLADACTSLLDLGAGPGSAAWAAAGRLPLARLTLVERDAAMIALGQALAQADAGTLAQATWVRADLRSPPPLERHDLVTISYALNELAPEVQDAAVDLAWSLAGQALLLVEAGTPRGAGVLARARTRLFAAGAHPVAPCPHAGPCPLSPVDPAGRPGWCRQAVRLPRSHAHRIAKGGARGHEDEPFSYLMCARVPPAHQGVRIVAPPGGGRHQVELTCCTGTGLSRRVLRPRDGEAFAAARNAAWGDWWDGTGG